MRVVRRAIHCDGHTMSKNIQPVRPSAPDEPGVSPTVAPVSRERYRDRLGDLAERYALVAVWILTIIVFSILRPDIFPTAQNFQTIFGSQSILVILTLGLMLPLVVGQFDLSIGAAASLSAVVIAVLNVRHGWPIGFALTAAMGVGLGVGVLNGLLVVVLGVDALVATLGVGTLLTGLAYAASDYNVISGVDRADFVNVVSYDIFGLPISFYVAIVLALVLWYVFRYTPLGRHLIFTGASRDVARLSGLPVQRLRLGAFIACSLFAAFAGVILTGIIGAGDANSGLAFLLPAYAAAFLGSTAIRPGQFNPLGTVVAVYFLVTGITGLQLLGLASWIQDVFYGLALIVAVTLSRLVAIRRNTA
jgi:ribose transport system permease protein